MNTPLIPDLITMIYKKKTSMIVHEINQQIINVERELFKADDIYCHNQHGNNHFWDNDSHNVYVLRYKKLNIKPINLDYITMRNLGFQWTYICNDCGEFLKQSPKKQVQYYCHCCEYV